MRKIHEIGGTMNALEEFARILANDILDTKAAAQAAAIVYFHLRNVFRNQFVFFGLFQDNVVIIAAGDPDDFFDIQLHEF